MMQSRVNTNRKYTNSLNLDNGNSPHIKSHRPQPCSFCHSGFFRNLFHPKKFEFCTNFSSENCVLSNSPFSMFSVCSCFEKCFLCLCQFTDSKNIGRFRKRNLRATIQGDTEFQAGHEYEIRLVKFVN